MNWRTTTLRFGLLAGLIVVNATACFEQPLFGAPCQSRAECPNPELFRCDVAEGICVPTDSPFVPPEAVLLTETPIRARELETVEVLFALKRGEDDVELRFLELPEGATFVQDDTTVAITWTVPLGFYNRREVAFRFELVSGSLFGQGFAVVEVFSTPGGSCVPDPVGSCLDGACVEVAGLGFMCTPAAVPVDGCAEGGFAHTWCDSFPCREVCLYPDNNTFTPRRALPGEQCVVNNNCLLNTCADGTCRSEATWFEQAAVPFGDADVRPGCAPPLVSENLPGDPFDVFRCVGRCSPGVAGEGCLELDGSESADRCQSNGACRPIPCDDDADVCAAVGPGAVCQETNLNPARCVVGATTRRAGDLCNDASACPFGAECREQSPLGRRCDLGPAPAGGCDDDQALVRTCPHQNQPCMDACAAIDPNTFSRAPNGASCTDNAQCFAGQCIGNTCQGAGLEFSDETAGCALPLLQVGDRCLRPCDGPADCPFSTCDVQLVGFAVCAPISCDPTEPQNAVCRGGTTCQPRRDPEPFATPEHYCR